MDEISLERKHTRATKEITGSGKETTLGLKSVLKEILGAVQHLYRNNIQKQNE